MEEINVLENWREITYPIDIRGDPAPFNKQGSESVACVNWRS